MSGPSYLEYVSDEEIDDVVLMGKLHSATAAASSTMAMVRNEGDGSNEDDKAGEFETSLERELDSLVDAKCDDIE
eukprot:6287869-Amphidinium_carterae.5